MKYAWLWHVLNCTLGANGILESTVAVHAFEWLIDAFPKMYMILDLTVRSRSLRGITWLGHWLAKSGVSHLKAYRSDCMITNETRRQQLQCIELMNRRMEAIEINIWPIYYQWSVYDHAAALAAFCIVLFMVCVGWYAPHRAVYVRTPLIAACWATALYVQALVYSAAVEQTRESQLARDVMVVQKRAHMLTTFLHTAAVMSVAVIGAKIGAADHVFRKQATADIRRVKDETAERCEQLESDLDALAQNYGTVLQNHQDELNEYSRTIRNMQRHQDHLQRQLDQLLELNQNQNHA